MLRTSGRHRLPIGARRSRRRVDVGGVLLDQRWSDRAHTAGDEDLFGRQAGHRVLRARDGKRRRHRRLESVLCRVVQIRSAGWRGLPCPRIASRDQDLSVRESDRGVLRARPLHRARSPSGRHRSFADTRGATAESAAEGSAAILAAREQHLAVGPHGGGVAAAAIFDADGAIALDHDTRSERAGLNRAILARAFEEVRGGRTVDSSSAESSFQALEKYGVVAE